MKALENLTRDAVTLACLGCATFFGAGNHPVYAGLFLAIALATWFGERL